MICYFDAVHELVGGQIGGPTNGPVSKYRFHDGQTPPTEEQIQAKYDELVEANKKLQYQRDRKYPELGEQFDLLFKDINEGTLDKTGGFYTAIKAVKDAHPKPE